MLFRSTRRAVFAALLIAAAVAPQVAQAAPKRDVTIMSRNLYVGANVVSLAAAKDEQDMEQRAQALHKVVDQTNFPVRAKAITAEIKRTKPDIIGFQELARYYRGQTGVHDNIRNATIPLYNFRKIMEADLKAAGLHYKVVSDQIWLDVEVPSADGYDIRLQQANTVFMRTGKGARVKFLHERHGVFASQLTIPLFNQSVKQTRGWAGVDAKVAGKKFRFIDPHAEAYSDDIATKQFKELVAAKNGAKSKKLTTIVAGDFNSDPSAPGAASGGYDAVVGAGFKETGKKAATCCQDELLDNTQSKLDKWIDHIMVRPAAKVLKRIITGNLPTDRINGLWPSDHAGVVVKLRLRK